MPDNEKRHIAGFSKKNLDMINVHNTIRKEVCLVYGLNYFNNQKQRTDKTRTNGMVGGVLVNAEEVSLFTVYMK